MLIVMGWGLLMTGLVLVVSQTVINQILPSDRSEHSYAALSAAEAGLADIEARLQVGTIGSVAADGTNAAMQGWVPVPGGNTTSEYTYALDATKSGAVGEVRAYSSGRSGGVVRTVEAVLSKRSTLDYVYMSDIETPSPDTPGVYSTSQYGSSGLTYQQIARLLCDRRWVEPGPVTVNSTTGAVTNGLQRNLRFCKWAGIYSSERLVGKLHTNDVWWLQNTSLTSTLELNGITSSCRSTAEGLAPGEVGCPQARRFIATSQVSSGTPSQYQGDTWAITGSDSTQRNPLYDSVLDLPPNPDLLKQRAAETGCIFTGPTRIRFSEEGGIGYMYVTSPDTKLTRAGCDGGDGTTLQSPATAQVTRKVALTDFTDLVIYVQDVRPSTEVDVPGADYDDPEQKYYWEKQNRWTSGTEPTCTLKSGRKYPYVIPDDAVDRGFFNSGSTYRGFPSEQADINSPWYGSACASGDLYVQGQYKGAIMLASDNNIILTSSLRDSQLHSPSATAGQADFGRPSPTSQSVLGIAATRFAYAYRPIESDDSWVGDWKTSNASNVIYNFALLAIQHCFGAQDYDESVNNGGIYLWGSIAQKFRCAVGISGGSAYSKFYKYDDRLTQRTPPYMLELSDEPWGDERTGEVTPARQPTGQSVTYQLLRADDPGTATIRNVKLAAAPDRDLASMTTGASSVTVSSQLPGLVVMTYEVVTTDTRDVRRLVVLAE
jgi:hypothetical protein